MDDLGPGGVTALGSSPQSGLPLKPPAESRDDPFCPQGRAYPPFVSKLVHIKNLVHQVELSIATNAMPGAYLDL